MHARKRSTAPCANGRQPPPGGGQTGNTTGQAGHCLFCRYRRAQAQGKEASNA